MIQLEIYLLILNSLQVDLFTKSSLLFYAEV